MVSIKREESEIEKGQTIQRMIDTQTFIRLSLKDLKYPSSHYCPAVVLKVMDNRIPVSL